jgi:hypothetical protein
MSRRSRCAEKRHVAERVAEVPDYGDVEELAVVELDALEEDQGGGGGMLLSGRPVVRL